MSSPASNTDRFAQPADQALLKALADALKRPRPPRGRSASRNLGAA